LSKVSEKYYAILKEYFEPLHKWSLGKGYLGPKVAECIGDLYSPQLMKATLLTLSKELKELDWKAQMNFVESIKGLRTAYLGHAYLYMNYPETTFDFIKKTAMYSDTIIINDPILSELLSWEKRGSGDISAFNLVAQYSVRLLTMENLFRSDLDPPICCLAPCAVLSLGSKDVYGPTDRLIEEYIVPTYAGRIFNKNFGSSEELVTFLGSIKDFNEFIFTVRKSGVPFTNPDGSHVTLSDFLRVKEYYEDKYEMSLDFSRALFLLLRGRYSMPAYDLAVNGRIATNFATDFKGVWESFDGYSTTTTTKWQSRPRKDLFQKIP
jgi:hypothetical protein